MEACAERILMTHDHDVINHFHISDAPARTKAPLFFLRSSKTLQASLVMQNAWVARHVAIWLRLKRRTFGKTFLKHAAHSDALKTLEHRLKAGAYATPAAFAKVFLLHHCLSISQPCFRQLQRSLAVRRTSISYS
jgi:hypothetical protein